MPATDSLDRLVLRAREKVDVARPVLMPLFAAPLFAAPPHEAVQPMELDVRTTTASARLARSARPAAPVEVRDRVAARSAGETHDAAPAPRQSASAGVREGAEGALRPAASATESMHGHTADREPQSAAPRTQAHGALEVVAHEARAAAPTRNSDALLEQLFEHLASPAPSASDAPGPSAGRAPRAAPRSVRAAVTASSMAETSSLAAQPLAGEQVVRVTIGQVVVRALTPPHAPPAARAPARQGPSLEDYLARGGRP